MKRILDLEPFEIVSNRTGASEVPGHSAASYPTPVDAFGRWPGLPIRQSKIFRPGMEDNAMAWLSQARKRIDAGVWEPAAVKKSRAVAQRVTMNDYYKSLI